MGEAYRTVAAWIRPDMPASMIWHSATIDEVTKELSCNTNDGLVTEELEQRYDRYGFNVYGRIERKTIWQHLLNQFTDFMFIILMVAATASAALSIIRGDDYWLEVIIIFGIVLLNFVISFVQERIANNTLEKLKIIAAPHIKAKRFGKWEPVYTSSLVPGDIIHVESGDIVPADARLFRSERLVCDDRIVTFDNLPVKKNADTVLTDQTPISQRSNLIYSGATVTHGWGEAIVVETGESCEIAKLIDAPKHDEKLASHKTLKKLSRVLGIVALVACVIYIIIGRFVMHNAIIDVIMTAAAIAVAIIPENVPTIVSVVVAVSVKRMAEKNAYLKSSDTIEILKDVSVICTDKTGALTSSDMVLKKAWAQTKTAVVDDEKLGDITVLLKLSALCCDARFERDAETKQKKYLGDPSEIAMIIASEKLGYNKNTLENTLPRIGCIPFDPQRQLMSTINIINGKSVAIVKGAPELLLQRCTHGSMRRAKSVAQQMAAEGLSVFIVAYKYVENVSAHPDPKEIEFDLTLAGVIGIEDPSHTSAILAVEKCNALGITPVMLTGDSLGTATSVARQTGILTGNKKAIHGDKLDTMSDDRLVSQVAEIGAMARVTAVQKSRIVKAWQKKKAVVALTGRRLSDVSSLRSADVSFALGKTGKESVKNAADVILTNDSFSAIVDAVHYSRGAYDNIRKIVRFLLGCHIGELIAVFFALFAGWGAPLLAIELLWVNLVTDSLPAIALSTEKPELQYAVPKRNCPEQLFSGTIGIYAILEGLMFGFITIFTYALGRFVILGCSPEIGRTMAFAALSFSQLIHANNVRSKSSLFKIGVISNRFLLGAGAISVALVLLVMLTPAKYLFGLCSLSIRQWLLTLGMALIPFVIMEPVKLIRFLIKRHIAKRNEKIAAIAELTGAIQ